MNDLIHYLKQATGFFKPPMMPLERFILEHGKDFKAAKRPKGLRKMRDKECFQNATHLNMARGLRYVEGYAVHDGLIPMMHAWNIDENDTIIDATWRYPERSIYRGVVIPDAILRRELLKNKVYGVLDTGLINLKLIEELKAAKEKAA